jgi:hypothetical protein
MTKLIGAVHNVAEVRKNVYTNSPGKNNQTLKKRQDATVPRIAN